MSALRVVGLSLVVLVGLAFVGFGVDDVLMTGLPPMHQAYADRHQLAPSEPVVAMVSCLAMAGSSCTCIAWVLRSACSCS